MVPECDQRTEQRAFLRAHVGVGEQRASGRGIGEQPAVEAVDQLFAFGLDEIKAGLQGGDVELRCHRDVPVKAVVAGGAAHQRWAARVGGPPSRGTTVLPAYTGVDSPPVRFTRCSEPPRSQPWWNLRCRSPT
jgi:hypothetical protein